MQPSEEEIMTNIEFLVSVDGAAPKAMDVQQVAYLSRLIVSMRSAAPVTLPVTSEPPRVEVPVTNRGRFFPPTPPIGERSIDYAIKAALSFGNASFTLNELLLGMESRGWTTRSETKRDKVNVVRATVRSRSDFTNHGEGLWTYEPKQQNSPPPDSQETDKGLFVQS